MKYDNIIHIDATKIEFSQSCCICLNSFTCKYYIKHLELIKLLFENNKNNAATRFLKDLSIVEKLSKLCGEFERKPHETTKK